MSGLNFMKLFSTKRKRRRKTIEEKIKEFTDKHVISEAEKDPQLLEAVIAKYSGFRMQSGEDEIEVIKRRIEAKIYRKMEETILENRSAELDTRINDLVDAFLAGINTRET